MEKVRQPGDDTDTSLAMSGLVWGVKSRFIAYLNRIPDSACVVGAGAGVVESGEFYFELENTDLFDRQLLVGTIKFRGQIRFTAHLGVLSVRIADPWVHLDPNGPWLSIEKSDGQAAEARTGLLRLSGGTPRQWGDMLEWPAMTANLIESGVPMFDDIYPVGAQMDDVRMRV